jgi:hypothetical protein
MTTGQQPIGAWRSRLLGAPLSAFEDTPGELLARKRENRENPSDQEGDFLATPTEKTRENPPASQGCCIRGCRFPRAEGDLVYCAGHRLMARTDTLWPEPASEPAPAPDPAVWVGHPDFIQDGPDAGRETAESRDRCVLCPERLADGSALYCSTHRLRPAVDTTPRCHGCGEPLGRDRLTLPRAKTGDLQFHGYACEERWRAASHVNQEALLASSL